MSWNFHGIAVLSGPSPGLPLPQPKNPTQEAE